MRLIVVAVGRGLVVSRLEVAFTERVVRIIVCFLEVLVFCFNEIWIGWFLFV